MRSETAKRVRIDYEIHYKHYKNPKAFQTRSIVNVPVADSSPAGVRKAIQEKIAEMSTMPVVYRGTEYPFSHLTATIHTIYTTVEIETYKGKELETFLKEV